MYSVYILPEENYAGYTTTKRLGRRMSEHRYKGRNTEGWMVPAEFDTEYEAKEFEEMLHEDGMLGDRTHISGAPVLNTLNGIFYSSMKEAWNTGIYKCGYRHFQSMLNGQKTNFTPFIRLEK